MKARKQHRRGTSGPSQVLVPVGRRTPALGVKRRLTFECSQEFFQQVTDERAERHLTLQQLAIRALERYLAAPEWLHRGIDEVVSHSGGSTTLSLALRDAYGGFMNGIQGPHDSGGGKPVNAPGKGPATFDKPLGESRPAESAMERVARSAAEQALEIMALRYQIAECLEEFPLEKLRLLRESLILDLKYYRSARIKPSRTARRLPPAK